MHLVSSAFFSRVTSTNKLRQWRSQGQGPAPSSQKKKEKKEKRKRKKERERKKERKRKKDIKIGRRNLEGASCSVKICDLAI